MGEMGISQAFEEFKSVHMPAVNYAFRTRKEYSHDLQELVDFLDGIGVHKVGDMNLSYLERYLATLDEKGFAGATRKRKVVVIHTFFNFLAREGYLANDISKRLITPFAEQNMPRVLTQNEYQRLLEACQSHPRDFAIITLLLQTGIRLSELVRLKIQDIELPVETENSRGFGQLNVIGGNGRKDRTLPLNSKACETLRSYLHVRPDATIGNVFLNRSGKVFGGRGVEKMLYKYLAKTSIFGASVHTLRHTFATYHAAKGTSLKTIQKVMGHKDQRTTEVYFSLAKQIQSRELQENAL
jgi:site-specific recombinase XerD